MTRVDVVTKRPAGEIIGALEESGVRVEAVSARAAGGGCHRYTLSLQAPHDHRMTELQRTVTESGGRLLGTVTGGRARAGNGQVVPMPRRRRQYVGAQLEDGPGPDGGVA
ncbi:hypothetical protein SAMN05660831_02070 [Thiohalospira halophila DSM 15071]|uniref:ACT domain-containing protein n=1 Tax=Thiohalospira halophila DSM 15071 TaxID=1123397 RepID=A0A1I1U8N9_9GAMM|nr:hypothetical protein [Thiohalospira halophila]SFD67231.1 hypothetical protein SAMN05660831_02070 [Thiohalospira halophila DSM 15071]